MYQNMITEFAASTGADRLAISLASAPAQRDGIVMSSGRCASSALVGVSDTGAPVFGNGVWLSSKGTPVSTLEAARIKAAVRVRPLGDAHVPGSLPRGAPV